MPDPHRLEQTGGAAGEDGDRARALVGDVGLLEHRADGVDVGAQRHPVVVAEPAVDALDLVVGVVHQRGDRARPRRGGRELRGIEVQVDGEDAAVLGSELREPAQARACEGVGHAQSYPAGAAETQPLSYRTTGTLPA